MTNTLTVVRLIRLGFAASLLGAALLIGSARAASAAEITPTPISAPIFAPIFAPVSQAQDADQAQPATTPAGTRPAPLTLPQVGAVGFGWG
jgi:hypothetical protein